MSDSTMSKHARELGLRMTPRGARASLRNSFADGAVPREVAEACLACTVKGVDEAYQRSDLLSVLTEAMQQWARYVPRTEPTATSLRSRRLPLSFG